MKIIPIPIPTPFPVGDVNVYLIREEPLTLVDTGPKTAEALAALRAGLAREGVKLSDLRRVVLTHAHEDHCGLAKTIRDASQDVEIFVHAWETGHLFGRLDREENQHLLRRAGVPEDVRRKLRDFYAYHRIFTDSLAAGGFSELKDGAEIEFAGGVLRVLHTPGHTPGSCSLLREANRTLIAGDSVLKRITPNPILAPDPVDETRRFRSLAEYLVSLARIRACAPTLVYTGHGEPVSDFEEIFRRYVRSIDGRQAQIAAALDSRGATAYDIAGKIFPDAVEKDSQRFLAVSEAIAHLDYAGQAGKIAVEAREGVEFYRKL